MFDIELDDLLESALGGLVAGAVAAFLVKRGGASGDGGGKEREDEETGGRFGVEFGDLLEATVTGIVAGGVGALILGRQFRRLEKVMRAGEPEPAAEYMAPELQRSPVG